MGCCFSSSNSPSAHSPYPHSPTAAADASSRNIITSSPPHPSSLLSHTPRASHASHVRPASPPHQASVAPNSPLKPLDPTHKCSLPATSSPHHHYQLEHSEGVSESQWTRSRLMREREDFFDTRVTGRPEVWAVVRLVVELVRCGEIAEAQGVLDAAGCTCPTGEVWKGVFDERGEWYKVPEWVVVEPKGLVEGDIEGDEGGSRSEEDGEEAVVEKLEKGKGKAVEGVDVGVGTVGGDKGVVVKVRVRLSDRGTDVVIKIGKEEKVSVLVRRIRAVAGIPPPTRLKIAYLGKMLHEHDSLVAQGWCDGHVVNALVFQ